MINTVVETLFLLTTFGVRLYRYRRHLWHTISRAPNEQKKPKNTPDDVVESKVIILYHHKIRTREPRERWTSEPFNADRRQGLHRAGHRSSHSYGSTFVMIDIDWSRAHPSAQYTL